jgi:cytochrome c553
MSKRLTIGWVSLCALTAALTAALAAAQTATQRASPLALPHAAGSAQEGASKAVVCVACHGANGNSTNPEWPNLAGQNATYIAEQLQLFRARVRNNVLMTPLAATLTDEDIADLAVHFEAQTPAGLEADPSYWKAGEQLYRGGDAERQIPSCIACHGPAGQGNPASGYPALQAQHSVYTVKQLTDYSRDARYQLVKGAKLEPRNDEMMATIAKRLTSEDIRNLASYIQGLR